MDGVNRRGEVGRLAKEYQRYIHGREHTGASSTTLDFVAMRIQTKARTLLLQRSVAIVNTQIRLHASRCSLTRIYKGVSGQNAVRIAMLCLTFSVYELGDKVADGGGNCAAIVCSGVEGKEL